MASPPHGRFPKETQDVLNAVFGASPSLLYIKAVRYALAQNECICSGCVRKTYEHGNPHCVVHCPNAVESARQGCLGPVVEQTPAAPQRVVAPSAAIERPAKRSKPAEEPAEEPALFPGQSAADRRLTRYAHRNPPPPPHGLVEAVDEGIGEPSSDAQAEPRVEAQTEPFRKVPDLGSHGTDFPCTSPTGW